MREEILSNMPVSTSLETNKMFVPLYAEEVIVYLQMNLIE